MSEACSTIDSVLDLCQHHHRRIVLAILAGKQRSLTLTDLTQAIRKYNQQASRTEVPEEVLTEIRLLLYHAHLPKLASAGLITYDRDRQLVDPTEQFEQVQPTVSTILDADPTLETPIELKCRSTALPPRLYLHLMPDDAIEGLRATNNTQPHVSQPETEENIPHQQPPSMLAPTTHSTGQPPYNPRHCSPTAAHTVPANAPEAPSR